MSQVLYWFDPADDHYESGSEWSRRYAKPVIAAARAIDWNSRGFQDRPCVWVRVGTVNNHRAMRQRHGRVTTECVAFDLPDEIQTASVRRALEAIESPWKLAVTDADEKALAVLPVRAALVVGIYVLLSGWTGAANADHWSELLKMPAVAPDSDLELQWLSLSAGTANAYPALITLLARAVSRGT